MCWYISDFIKVYFLVKYMYLAKYTNHKWATQWIFTANILILIPRRSKKETSAFQKVLLSSYQSYFIKGIFSFDVYQCIFFLLVSYIHGVIYCTLFCACLFLLFNINIPEIHPCWFIQQYFVYFNCCIVFYYLYIPLFWYLGCS